MKHVFRQFASMGPTSVKISDLIKMLQEALKSHGDVKVVVLEPNQDDYQDGDYREPLISVMDGGPISGSIVL